MVAAVFEAELDAHQAAGLARLMDEGRPTRPAGVMTATLLYDGSLARLVAVWERAARRSSGTSRRLPFPGARS
jgi:hypothetical protein